MQANPEPARVWPESARGEADVQATAARGAPDLEPFRWDTQEDRRTGSSALAHPEYRNLPLVDRYRSVRRRVCVGCNRYPHPMKESSRVNQPIESTPHAGRLINSATLPGTGAGFNGRLNRRRHIAADSSLSHSRCPAWPGCCLCGDASFLGHIRSLKQRAIRPRAALARCPSRSTRRHAVFSHLRLLHHGRGLWSTDQRLAGAAALLCAFPRHLSTLSGRADDHGVHSCLG